MDGAKRASRGEKRKGCKSRGSGKRKQLQAFQKQNSSPPMSWPNEQGEAPFEIAPAVSNLEQEGSGGISDMFSAPMKVDMNIAETMGGIFGDDTPSGDGEPSNHLAHGMQGLSASPQGPPHSDHQSQPFDLSDPFQSTIIGTDVEGTGGWRVESPQKQSPTSGPASSIGVLQAPMFDDSSMLTTQSDGMQGFAGLGIFDGEDQNQQAEESGHNEMADLGGVEANGLQEQPFAMQMGGGDQFQYPADAPEVSFEFPVMSATEVHQPPVVHEPAATQDVLPTEDSIAAMFEAIAPPAPPPAHPPAPAQAATSPASFDEISHQFDMPSSAQRGELNAFSFPSAAPPSSTENAGWDLFDAPAPTPAAASAPAAPTPAPAGGHHSDGLDAFALQEKPFTQGKEEVEEDEWGEVVHDKPKLMVKIRTKDEIAAEAQDSSNALSALAGSLGAPPPAGTNNRRSRRGAGAAGPQREMAPPPTPQLLETPQREHHQSSLSTFEVSGAPHGMTFDAMQGISFPPPAQQPQHNLPPAQDNLGFAFPQTPALPPSASAPAPHASSEQEKLLMRRVEELSRALESAREAQNAAGRELRRLGAENSQLKSKNEELEAAVKRGSSGLSRDNTRGELEEMLIEAKLRNAEDANEIMQLRRKVADLLADKGLKDPTVGSHFLSSSLYLCMISFLGVLRIQALGEIGFSTGEILEIPLKSGGQGGSSVPATPASFAPSSVKATPLNINKYLEETRARTGAGQANQQAGSLLDFS
ncbi:hypothetical protein GUITHDRAFT_142810 [Guillardia theta CCMP2712]|uniref:Uncharacterized protein n=1 Tax=Guillardia theta (strain CCMP2712) TaxID=905079 RepID=L1IW55_GUITC|nr:hypothetical protein GUITHDRAFT_142810 [Guillardia theta CCMP2712]EKX40307.1 hypothetical protein GUITHDRAFT_142810 [Guillardia theta CCMP2712]|eukprot:XP_005827287.1 hypothetical protein GUITHDRAFT_142810 [Guillardia theta CCMP2712]